MDGSQFTPMQRAEIERIVVDVMGREGVVARRRSMKEELAKATEKSKAIERGLDALASERASPSRS